MQKTSILGTLEWESIRILGVRIDLVDYTLTTDIMRECISNRTMGNYICVTPVHPIMVSRSDQDLREALENSKLSVPDGMPVVWAARLLGGKIQDRVYGPNLMLRACAMAECEGYSVFLYGGKPETLIKLKNELADRFPNLRIAGSYSPPFRKLLPKEEEEIIQAINSASPDLLFIGLGAPKQEKWMARHCPKMNVPVTIGVGAAFDFLSGEKKQAPAWMQSRGLEWIFRLINEPKRLLVRYLVYNPLFILFFLKQLTWSSSKP